jgi:hypothetical protein
MLLSENKSFTPQSFIGSFSFDGCGDIGISLTLRLLLLSIIVIVSSSSPLLLCLLLLLAFTTREVSTSSERIEFIGNASFLEEEEAFKEDEGLEEEEEEKPSKRPILFVSSPRSIRLSS